MSQEVNVDTDAMFELLDAMKQFENAMQTLETDVVSLTRGLSSDMEGCSRYDAVVDQVQKAMRKLKNEAVTFSRVRADLAERADFMYELERGDSMTERWRNDDI